MSYYHAKKTAEAKRYLDERDREQAIRIIDDRRQRSIDWLAKYHASSRAQTRFDWRPRWSFNPQPREEAHQPPESETTNAQSSIIEGEFTVVSEVDPSFTEADLTPF